MRLYKKCVLNQKRLSDEQFYLTLINNITHEIYILAYFVTIEFDKTGFVVFNALEEKRYFSYKRWTIVNFHYDIWYNAK